MIAAVLLAAGSARRFGAPKLLQDLAGKPVVRWSAEALAGAPVDEVVVVVPPDYGALRAALDGLDVRFVVNPDPAAGMGASLACGVAALGSRVEAALVALADEPSRDRSVLAEVVDRYRTGDASIVVPLFRGTRGHPVLFDRSVFAELLALTGDRGARDITDRDPGRVAIVELAEDEPVDVDTPADLSRLRSAPQFMSPTQPKPR
ncbi:MAG: nucleotidyltransferase family protein [Gemmatimonadaceae bacterium]